MYRYLDRRVTDLGEPQRFLLAAMRLWVESARGGRCCCAALVRGFAHCRVGAAVRDFGIAMTALDRDALEKLTFGCRRAMRVREDEARMLTLFDAALGADAPRVRRIAATLVRDETTATLATAVEWVAVRLSDGSFMEHDQ